MQNFGVSKFIFQMVYVLFRYILSIILAQACSINSIVDTTVEAAWFDHLRQDHFGHKNRSCYKQT